MRISYNKLWKMLIDKEMNKNNLKEMLPESVQHLLPSGTPSMYHRQVLWQMQSSTASLMTAIASTSQALMPNMTSQCARYMA